jgi:hypothetical protein
MLELLPIGLGAALSAPVVVEIGDSLTLSLKTPENLLVGGGLVVYIDRQMSNGQWLLVDHLSTSEPALYTAAPGTYRVRRDIRCPTPVGVDYEL